MYLLIAGRIINLLIKEIFTLLPQEYDRMTAGDISDVIVLEYQNKVLSFLW